MSCISRLVMGSDVRARVLFACMICLAACASSDDDEAREARPPTPTSPAAPPPPRGANAVADRDAAPPTDAADGAAPVPVDLCGTDDWRVTSVSPSWGPSWAKPDPKTIVDGWPLALRYELWWMPMPKRVLAYRITVPATFDADPSPDAWNGYVHSVESPSTPVANYQASLSETPCETKISVPAQATTAPYAAVPSLPNDKANSIDVPFRVRPKNHSFCPGTWALPCLEPGRTYWFNIRLTDGCVVFDENGNALRSEPSKCQPMIHVMRPRQQGEP